MAINTHSSQTASGGYIDYLDPQPDQFTLDDICQGLARECRFNGQTRHYYSVAQHSVLVSLMVPKEFALEGLMHDGSEAFMRDISSPLKALLPDYARIEKGVQAAVYRHFGLPAHLEGQAAKAVKEADARMTMTERIQLMPVDDREWPGLTVKPYEIAIQPLNEESAAKLFIGRLISIEEDAPFLPYMELWVAQHDEWAQRCGQVVAEESHISPSTATHRLRAVG